MKKGICVFLIFSMLLTGAACTKIPRNRLQSVDQMSGMDIGIVGGTQAESYSERLTAEDVRITVFDDASQAAAALESAELDGILIDAETANQIQKEHKSLRILEDAYAFDGISAVTAKENSSLNAALSQAIAVLSESGALDAIVSHYVAGTTYTSPEPKGNTGIRMVTTERKPFAYRDEMGNPTGINVDVAKTICGQLEIGLTISFAERDELTDHVRKGRADFAMDTFRADDQTNTLVDYTDPYMTSHQVVIVRKK